MVHLFEMVDTALEISISGLSGASRGELALLNSSESRGHFVVVSLVPLGVLKLRCIEFKIDLGNFYGR